MTTADPGELADYTPPEEMEPLPEGLPFEEVQPESAEFLTPADMSLHLQAFHPGGEAQASDLAALEERVGNELSSLNSYSERAREAIVSMLDVEILSLRGDMNATIASVVDRIIALQSDMAAQVAVQAELEAEAGPGGFLGFVQSVAGFALSPIESLLEKVGEYILGEVEDGLNS